MMILKGLAFCFGHLYDIIIYSKSGKEHKDQIRQVLDHLCKANIKLKLTKCDFSEFKITETTSITMPTLLIH